MPSWLIGVLCLLFAIPGGVHDSWQMYERWRARGVKRPPLLPIAKVTGWLVLMCVGIAVLVTSKRKQFPQLSVPHMTADRPVAAPVPTASAITPPQTSEVSSKPRYKEPRLLIPPTGTPLAPIQQSSTGANSPNIVGNGATVNYLNTSPVPDLTADMASLLTTQLSFGPYHLRTVVNTHDESANRLALDLIEPFLRNHWRVETATYERGPISPFPLMLNVHDDYEPGAEQTAKALSRVLGVQVPVTTNSEVPQGQLDFVIVSHPRAMPER